MTKSTASKKRKRPTAKRRKKNDAQTDSPCPHNLAIAPQETPVLPVPLRRSMRVANRSNQSESPGRLENLSPSQAPTRLEKLSNSQARTGLEKLSTSQAPTGLEKLLTSQAPTRLKEKFPTLEKSDVLRLVVEPTDKKKESKGSESENDEEDREEDPTFQPEDAVDDPEEVKRDVEYEFTDEDEFESKRAQKRQKRERPTAAKPPAIEMSDLCVGLLVEIKGPEDKQSDYARIMAIDEKSGKVQVQWALSYDGVAELFGKNQEDKFENLCGEMAFSDGDFAYYVQEEEHDYEWTLISNIVSVVDTEATGIDPQHTCWYNNLM